MFVLLNGFDFSGFEDLTPPEPDLRKSFCFSVRLDPEILDDLRFLQKYQGNASASSVVRFALKNTASYYRSVSERRKK